MIINHHHKSKNNNPLTNSSCYKRPPHPLPDEDVVYDGCSTEHNSKTNHYGCHYRRGLVEMEKCEENNSWKYKCLVGEFVINILRGITLQ